MIIIIFIIVNLNLHYGFTMINRLSYTTKYRLKHLNTILYKFITTEIKTTHILLT